MISLQEWKKLREFVAPPAGGNEEEPNQEDYNFYQTTVQGPIKRYLAWLVEELETSGQKLNMIRKGFIIQEVMDALGLTPAQVTRLSNNIKRGMVKSQHMTGQGAPAVNRGGLPTGAMETPGVIVP